jgi:hypothetical protein
MVCTITDISLIADNRVGYRVAQVRLIFTLRFDDPLHPLHEKPLAYVQWFSKPHGRTQKSINMYRVERLMDGAQPKGDIVALSSISRYVQLVPHFGRNTREDRALTELTSMDRCQYFYVNSFADKEIYQAVY